MKATPSTAVEELVDRYLAGSPVDEGLLDQLRTSEVVAELLRRLNANEEGFRLLVDSVQDYAIFMLDPAGRVTSWNNGAERIKGYRRDEIVGRHFSIFYTSEDLAARKPAHALASAKRHGRWSEEGWRLRKDGTRFLANVTITALREPDGKLRGFAKVTRDITDMRRLQDRVLTAERRETARYQRMADQMRLLEELKSRFLNLASHELRTPVSLIRGYVSMFEDGDLGVLTDNGRAALAVLREQTDQLHSLIGQMLEGAALELGSIELVKTSLDLRDELRSAVALARANAGPEQRITLSLPPKPVRVTADRDRLAQILHRIFDNAIKYSPAESTVNCELSQSARFAHVVVSDDGIGLTREQRHQLFAPFGRHVDATTAAIPGVGMGLFLARSLARLHGGDLGLEPERPSGSAFRLTLPLRRRR